MNASASVRLACVDLPALPLQLLLRREPGWARHPAVVVERDEPQAKILWVNERARRLRVLPGRRYAEGLSLAPDLRAGLVDAAEIEAAVASVVRRLLDFSPDVEPLVGEPGAFVVDAAGLEGVFPSRLAWAQAIAAGLREDRLIASVVVGFTRFGCRALARAGPGVRVLSSAAE
jgi:protein ImuB